MTTSISRRRFLKQGGALTTAASAGMPFVMNLLASSSAMAATTGGYKALVCVFLAGGNDAHNTVIRTDKGKERFMAARAAVGREVMSADGLYTPLNPLAMTSAQNRTGITGLSLALHPSLSNVKSYFESGRLAIIGNIGPLAGRTTFSAYQSGTAALPPKLFSHNDQTSMWQSGQPEGAISGWGGELVRRFAEQNLVNGQNSQLFSAVAIEASPVFCAGTNAKMPDAKPVVSPFGASRVGGALRPGGLDRDEKANPPGPYLIHWSLPRDDVLTKVFNGTTGRGESTTAGVLANNLIEADYLSKLNSANEAWKASSKAMSTVALTQPVPANNSLATQLSVVAQMIKSSGNDPLSMGRQVFFVQLGGFDTHSGQIGTDSPHKRLLKQVDEALKYFDDELGADRSKVTTFTASEFGRKLNENGDGTDHGWGGHQFVMGGAVQGGAYGYFPDLSTWDAASSTYTDGQLMADGTLIPSVPVDLLAKELGKWMGVEWTAGSNALVAAQLFPNLKSDVAMLGFTA